MTLDSPPSAPDSDEKRSGRQLEGPAHPRKGSLGQTLKRTITEFKEDALTDREAALTYYAVLAVVPALLAMVAIVGLVGDPQTITKALNDRVSSVGPPSAADTFNGPIEGLTKSSGAAGVLVFVATSRSSSALSSTPSANEAVSSRPGPQAPAAGRPAPAA